MKLYYVTALGFHINTMLDANPNLPLTFAEVHKAAQNHRLVEFLAERFPNAIDVSLLLSDKSQLAQVNHALADAASYFDGWERRKAGVEKNALCLLIAIILEVIQRHDSAFRRRQEQEAGHPLPIAS